jgi:hypothetical protein
MVLAILYLLCPDFGYIQLLFGELLRLFDEASQYDYSFTLSSHIQTSPLRSPDFPNLALDMLHIGTSHILQANLFNELGYMGSFSFDISRKSVELSFGSFVEEFYTPTTYASSIAIVL